MNTLITISSIFLIIFSVLNCIGYCNQPSYQVSINIQLHPKGHAMPYCTGSIVQSRLILTAAICVFYQFSPSSTMVMISPEMLSVISGSTNAINDLVSIQVKSIQIHEQFIFNTMQNNIALLHLNESLPLASRNDMKWIILDDDETYIRPCLANFCARNEDHSQIFSQAEELEILRNDQCNISDFRNTQMCSQYVLPSDFDCKDISAFQRFDIDRGTALVCNSKLVGVLSTIIFPSSTNYEDCSTEMLNAIYTNVGAYLDWIYEIIAYEENIDIENNYFAASAPYQLETEAILQSLSTMTSDITSYIDSWSPTSSPNASEIWNNYIKPSRNGESSIQKLNFLYSSIILLFVLLNQYQIL